MNHPVVMPPSEIDATIDMLLDELARLDGDAAECAQRVLTPFRRDWRNLFARFGTATAGHDHYRDLARGMHANLAHAIGDIELPNGVAFTWAVSQLVAAAGLNPELAPGTRGVGGARSQQDLLRARLAGPPRIQDPVFTPPSGRMARVRGIQPPSAPVRGMAGRSLVAEVGRMVEPAMNREQRRTAGRRARRIGATLTAGSAATGTVVAVVGFLGATPAGALTPWTVNQLGDAGDTTCDATCTLRDAFLEANSDGDDSLIVFDASVTGTILLTGGRLEMDESGSDLTVTGPGSGLLTVDAQGASQIFYSDDSSGDDVTATLSGMTFTNGKTSGSGGAIEFYYEDDNKDLVLNDMVITGNEAARTGGGVYFYSEDGNLTIINSTISNNKTTVSGDGGGVAFYEGANLTIRNSTISGNSTAGSSATGGGLYVRTPGSVNISNSTFAGNHSVSSGGGIGIRRSDTVNIVQTTISGNTADNHVGDGLYFYNRSGALSLGAKAKADAPSPSDDPTKPPKEPKGQRTDVGALATIEANLIGAIVSGNAVTDIDADGVAPNQPVNSDHSLIGTVSDDITLTDQGGTIFSTDPGLGPLADNGGPTQTMALLSGSAAIDAGPDLVPTFPYNEFDQRGPGFPRVINGRVDIGAYELQPTVLVVRFTG